MLSSDNKVTFYKYLNNKLHSTNSISPLYDETNNVVLSPDFNKASYLSHQYQSDFNNSIDSNLPPLPAIGNIPSSQSASPSCSSYPTTPDVNLLKFLCQLPNKYNNSPDGIPKALLKILSFQLCYPLSIIYINILKTGICPDIW